MKVGNWIPTNFKYAAFITIWTPSPQRITIIYEIFTRINYMSCNSAFVLHLTFWLIIFLIQFFSVNLTILHYHQMFSSVKTF